MKLETALGTYRRRWDRFRVQVRTHPWFIPALMAVSVAADATVL